MVYQNTYLQQLIKIDSIISLHYFEFASNFTFPEESHDFWEFLCIERGESDIIINGTRLTLRKGEGIFFTPNDFHTIITNGKTTPHIIKISFRCDSDCMHIFENKLLTISTTEQILLAQIMTEAKKVFSSKLDDPYLEQLVRQPHNCTPGAEQLIQCYLEQFLILLYRRLLPEYATSAQLTTKKQQNSTGTYYQLLAYLSDHVNTQLTVRKICTDNLVSRSQLQQLFHDYHQCGVMDYFNQLKIDTAKQLIRDTQMNFSQISNQLGYTSVQYFCRQFKKQANMTPTEYAFSVKIDTDYSVPHTK